MGELSRIDRAVAEVRAARVELELARRGRARRILVAIAAILVGATMAYGIHRTWFGPPDLRVGSRHHVTLTFNAPRCATGLPTMDWTTSWAGYVWSSYRPPWGAATVTGTIIIDSGPPSSANDIEASPPTPSLYGERWATFMMSNAATSLDGIPERTAPSPDC